jgi:hypothetical protein
VYSFGDLPTMMTFLNYAFSWAPHHNLKQKMVLYDTFWAFSENHFFAFECTVLFLLMLICGTVQVLSSTLDSLT